ncbi:MAG: hypothetical protein ACR2F8_07965 [Caulobacteraceae bacterium]
MRLIPTFRAICLAAVTALASPPVIANAGSLKDENLVALMPKGFVVGKTENQGSILITEFVPTGETVHDWTQMVTVQIFHNLKRFDPDAFVGAIGKQWSAACEKSTVQKLKSGQENSYPFTLWLMSCPLNGQTGKPENTWVKAIEGNDSLYSVQYALRTGLTAEAIPR